jgi:uncharacterized protein (DUF1015 family)
MLHEAGIATTGLLDRLTDRAPDASARTDDGVVHALWVCPVGGGEVPLRPAHELLGLAGAVPLTIADGHHRYETALRYREERGTNRACESDPAWDYVLALLYDVGEAPQVVATHRVLLDGPTGEALLEALGVPVLVERVGGPSEVMRRMATPETSSAAGGLGSGRIGLVSGDVAAILCVGPVRAPDGNAVGSDAGAASELDVNRLGVLLARLGLDAGALAAGGRVAYVKGAAEAVAMARDGRATAFLLDPPPVTAVTRVASAGELMPQKSTYFDPKAPTGLVFGPLEW